MKRLIVLFAVVCALFSCGQKEKVWERPEVGSASVNYFDFDKVVFTDTNTAVYMQIEYPSMGTWRFARETYIEADGKRYAAIGSDSIVLGEYTKTDPVTWKKNFVLYFEPLPRNTKSFDMLEGVGPRNFNFFNIRPEGVKLPEAEIPADFLADYPEDDVWPDMVYSEDPVTIHLKALNYKPGMNAEITMWHFDITDPTSFNPKRVTLNENGEADYITKIYYPERIQTEYVASSSARYGSFALPILAPGEEITILMDMNVVADSVTSSFVGYKGYLAKFNKKYNDEMPLRYYDEEMPDFDLKGMKEAKTVSEIIAAREKLIKEYDAYYEKKGYNDLEKKHMFEYELRFFSLVADYADSLFRTQEFLDYVLRTRPACFFDDTYLLADPDYKDVCHLFANTDVRGKGPDFCRFLYGVTQIRGGKKVSKPFIEDPDLSNLYDRISGDINVEIEKNKKRNFDKNVHYLDLTDVAPENLLQTILNNYKGKTVVFDFWATWCAWCIKGHEEMAPLKETLKDKNIVFVYLTSTSSPFDNWMRAIPGIPGDHYYLTEEQDNYLSDHIFGTSGVPKYVIYDTAGKQLYTQVGWGGLDKIQTEIEKALKR